MDYWIATHSHFLNKSAMTVLTVKRKESHIYGLSPVEGSGADLLPPGLPGSEIHTSAQSSVSPQVSGILIGSSTPPLSTVENYSLLYNFTYISLGF